MTTNQSIKLYENGERTYSTYVIISGLRHPKILWFLLVLLERSKHTSCKIQMDTSVQMRIHSTFILSFIPMLYMRSIHSSLSTFVLGADLCLHGPHNWHFQLHCKQLINMHGFPSQYRSKQSRLESWVCQGREIGQTCQGQDFVNEGRAAE